MCKHGHDTVSGDGWCVNLDMTQLVETVGV